MSCAFLYLLCPCFPSQHFLLFVSFSPLAQTTPRAENNIYIIIIVLGLESMLTARNKFLATDVALLGIYFIHAHHPLQSTLFCIRRKHSLLPLHFTLEHLRQTSTAACAFSALFPFVILSPEAGLIFAMPFSSKILNIIIRFLPLWLLPEIHCHRNRFVDCCYSAYRSLPSF